MAKKEKKAETKGSNLKVRVTPQEKFMVDFTARVARESVSQLVIKAIEKRAETAVFRGKTYLNYFDTTPGFSFCLMCLDGLPMNKQEDDLCRFILTHRVFFFDGETPNRRRLDVLWDRVPHFADSYFRHMKTDSFIAGHEMNAALKEAKIKQIEWPQQEKDR